MEHLKNDAPLSAVTYLGHLSTVFTHKIPNYAMYHSWHTSFIGYLSHEISVVPQSTASTRIVYVYWNSSSTRLYAYPRTGQSVPWIGAQSGIVCP